MKRIVCSSCGANDFDTKNGNRICRYCGAKYLLTKEDYSVKSSYISMHDDVNRLLHKCVEEPETANITRVTLYEPYIISVTANGNAVIIEKKMN